MFERKSRYAKLEPYEVIDRRRRTVRVVPVPDAPAQSPLGTHLMRQGQRLDHLARKYLDDPAGFWRICEMNGTMLPESLTEALEVEIPARTQ